VLGAINLIAIGHQNCGTVISIGKDLEFPDSIGLILNKISFAIRDYLGKQANQTAIRKATEGNTLFD
jgi:hypothetical protein